MRFAEKIMLNMMKNIGQLYQRDLINRLQYVIDVLIVEKDIVDIERR